MKKLLVIMAVVLATVGGCSVDPYGIHNVEGYAVSEDSFNIEGEIFQIYDDVLEVGEMLGKALLLRKRRQNNNGKRSST